MHCNKMLEHLALSILLLAAAGCSSAHPMRPPAHVEVPDSPAVEEHAGTEHTDPEVPERHTLDYQYEVPVKIAVHLLHPDEWSVEEVRFWKPEFDSFKRFRPRYHMDEGWGEPKPFLSPREGRIILQGDDWDFYVVALHDLEDFLAGSYELAIRYEPPHKPKKSYGPWNNRQWLNECLALFEQLRREGDRHEKAGFEVAVHDFCDNQPVLWKDFLSEGTVNAIANGACLRDVIDCKKAAVCDEEKLKCHEPLPVAEIYHAIATSPEGVVVAPQQGQDERILLRMPLDGVENIEDIFVQKTHDNQMIVVLRSHTQLRQE